MEYELGPDESISRIVKRLIAREEECAPSQLGTLKATVEVDELEAAVDSAPDDQETRPRSLIFRYCGYAVEVHGDRTISIVP